MRSKEPTAVPSISAELEEVRRRLQVWRRKRKHGSRIPEALWRAAAKLAREHRPGKVAHALGLDYYRLKQRLDSAKENSASAPEARATFVELLPSVTDRECTFELDHPGGAKMTIHLKGVSTADLIALGRALWSAEA